MTEFKFQELNMMPITNLPDGWSLFDYHNGGRVITNFSQEIEYKSFLYIHESVIATVRIEPSRVDLQKRQPAIRLEMRLEFLLGNFVDRRLFETPEKAEIWAVGFMERFHKYHSSCQKVNKNG